VGPLFPLERADKILKLSAKAGWEAMKMQPDPIEGR
jgi:hypothetical protein